MTLQKLTGQESGIIVYGGSTVAVANWLECGENQIPLYMQFVGMIPWNASAGVFDGVEKRRSADIREELPGSVWLTGEADEQGNYLLDTDLDIVSDPNGDLVSVFLDTEPTSGEVFVLSDGRKIIAPDGWA